jgi:hypothetical protein
MTGLLPAIHVFARLQALAAMVSYRHSFLFPLMSA